MTKKSLEQLPQIRNRTSIFDLHWVAKSSLMLTSSKNRITTTATDNNNEKNKFQILMSAKVPMTVVCTSNLN